MFKKYMFFAIAIMCVFSTTSVMSMQRAVKKQQLFYAYNNTKNSNGDVYKDLHKVGNLGAALIELVGFLVKNVKSSCINKRKHGRKKGYRYVKLSKKND